MLDKYNLFLIIILYFFGMRFLISHIFKPYSWSTNPRFGGNLLHNLQAHVSHFHSLILILNSPREAASLYSDGSFTQRDDDLLVTVSIYCSSEVG